MVSRPNSLPLPFRTPATQATEVLSCEIAGAWYQIWRVYTQEEKLEFQGAPNFGGPPPFLSGLSLLLGSDLLRAIFV